MQRNLKLSIRTPDLVPSAFGVDEHQQGFGEKGRDRSHDKVFPFPVLLTREHQDLMIVNTFIQDSY